MQGALEHGWQRRQALEREVEQLRAELETAREAVEHGPSALAAERESLRRQIDDLLAVKLRMADELRRVLELLSETRQDVEPAVAAPGGRVHGDLDALVDGTVELAVEPVADFDTIAAVERALADASQVRDVHARTADGKRVVFEVALRARGPLLRALDGALPFDADAAVAGGLVTLRVRTAQ